MDSTTLSQFAKTRCYKCGSPEIHGICHHCGKGMCRRHACDKYSAQSSRLPARLGMWNASLLRFGLKSLDHQDYAGFENGFAHLCFRDECFTTLRLAIILNPEFEGYVDEQPPGPDDGSFQSLKYSMGRFKRRINLAWGNRVGQAGKLKYKQVTPMHCEICAHSVSRHPAVMWIGFLLTITVFGTILGIPLLILGYWLNRRYYIEAQKTQMTPIPLEGQIGEIEVAESISGRIELDASGKYSMHRGEMVGELTLPIRFTVNARKRYFEFLQKADDLHAGDTSNVPIDVGYMEIEAAEREFSEGDIWLSDSVNIIKLHADQHDNKISSFINHPDQEEAKWSRSYTYCLTNIIRPENNQTRNSLPLQVVVSIQPGSNRQALFLALELTDLDLPSITDTELEEFILRIPHKLGDIERLEPEGKSERYDQYRTLTWKKLRFATSKIDSQAQGKDLRCPIYLRFKNKIDAGTRLEGEIVLSIPAALSGAEKPRMYYPWGALRQEKIDYKAKTKLNISLDLDLSGLRYQKMMSDGTEIIRQGIVPDSKLVTDIVEILSEQDFYIKRITENPARVSKEGAHKVNRYWDLIGRKYEGVYPVDFHLVLTGEEVGVKGRYAAGQLQVAINVQGAVTNDDMEARVINVKDRLEALIALVLDRIPLIGPEKYEMEPLALPESGFETEPVIDNPAPIQGTPMEVLNSGKPRVEILKNLLGENVMERLRELQRRLDKLEQRFVDGEIPVEDYHDLKTRYEKEIWDLSDGELGQPA